MNIKHNFFKSTFFPRTLIEWNKLDPAIQNSASFNSFKESIFKFIRPAPNNIFQCHILKGIKYLTRLWVDFSTFVTPNSSTHFKTLCTCSLEVKTTNHCILHCPNYENERHILLASIGSIKSSILDQNDNNMAKTHFFVDSTALVKHRIQAF